MTGTLKHPDELERIARPRPDTEPESVIWDLAAQVLDPEVPVLTLADLGILRAARLEGTTAVVDITPTYSGCPAVDTMRADVIRILAENGYPDAQVRVVLSPAWTTDWMSEEGRRKLTEYGIAPPGQRQDGPIPLGLGIQCPRCGSLHTTLVTAFGSTACKAQYTCNRCEEPFDHFKEL